MGGDRRPDVINVEFDAMKYKKSESRGKVLIEVQQSKIMPDGTVQTGTVASVCESVPFTMLSKHHFRQQLFRHVKMMRAMLRANLALNSFGTKPHYIQITSKVIK